MSTVSPTQLRQAIRFRGDYRNATRFPDADVDRETQSSFGEFWELIADTNEGYWDTTATVATVASVPFVPLPVDNWRLHGVDIIIGGEAFQLQQVGISKRNYYGSTPSQPCAYRPTARGIDLYPTPDAVYTLRFTYTPSAPRLFDAQFIGASSVTFSTALGVLVVTASNPTGVVAGDTLLFAITSSSASGVPPSETLPDGWVSIASLATSGPRVTTILRRTATGDDPAHAIPLSAAAIGVGGVLLDYRNLNAAVDVVASDITAIAASKSFACPTIAAAAASDLYLGIAWSVTGASLVSPPAAGVERFEANQSSNGTSRTLEVFDLQAGVIGLTGTKTALAATSQTTGLAAAVLLSVGAPREYYNDWEEYVIYATMIRLAEAGERDTSEWQNRVDRMVQRIKGAASGRQSQSPELLVLHDGGDYPDGY